MKIFVPFIIFMLSQKLFAQIPYTDFIQNDTSIQWAAEYDQILNITPRVTKYGIRNIIHTKLLRGECIDDYNSNNEGVFKKSFCLKDTGITNPTFTSNINPYKFYYDFNDKHGYNKSEMYDSYQENLMKNKFHIYKVKQILYYKNDKLYINNALVTSLFLRNIVASDNIKFAWTSSFTSCFNSSNDKFTASIKKHSVDLGIMETNYNLLNGEDHENELKIFTKSNPSFSHHLFEAILSNKVTVVDEKENKIQNKKVFEVNNPPIDVPVYDDEGNIKVYKKMRNEINVDSFYNFSINQHFYYDSSKSILHSSVNFIDVYKRFITTSGVDLGNGFHFRIFFINPKLYKKRPQKRFLN